MLNFAHVFASQLFILKYFNISCARYQGLSFDTMNKGLVLDIKELEPFQYLPYNSKTILVFYTGVAGKVVFRDVNYLMKLLLYLGFA